MAELQFRKESIEKAATQGGLSQLIQITPTKNWIILSIIYILLFTLILWSFLGTISTRVKGTGILLSQGGGIFNIIMPSGSGRITSINVQPGMHVNKGDVVAYLENRDLAGKVEIAGIYLKSLQDKYSTLSKDKATDIENRQKKATEQDQILQKSLTEAQENLNKIVDLLSRLEEGAKKGVVSKEQLIATYNDFYRVKDRISELNNRIVQNKIDLDNYIQNYEQQLRQLSLRVVDAEKDLQNLKEQMKEITQIKSEISGVVTNISVAIGDNVSEGNTIISLASVGKGLDAIIFVPASEGQQVKVNAEVLLSPVMIKKAEYGSLVGNAIQVSRYPTTPGSMLALLHNDTLVKEFSQNGAPIAMRVRLLPDPNSLSGYQWTTQNGSTQTIEPGMIVSAEITLKEQRPISLILPVFKHYVYGEEL